MSSKNLANADDIGVSSKVNNKPVLIYAAQARQGPDVKYPNPLCRKGVQSLQHSGARGLSHSMYSPEFMRLQYRNV